MQDESLMLTLKITEIRMHQSTYLALDHVTLTKYIHRVRGDGSLFCEQEREQLVRELQSSHLVACHLPRSDNSTVDGLGDIYGTIRYPASLLQSHPSATRR